MIRVVNFLIIGLPSRVNMCWRR